MDKLKTLRDIQNKHGFHWLKSYSKDMPQNQMTMRVRDGSEEMAVFPSELKQEAIKWIKQDNLQELFLSGRIDLIPEIREILGDGIKTWIKHFFNITDEDLNKLEEKQ